MEFGRFKPDDVELTEGHILIMNKKYGEGLNFVYNNHLVHEGDAVVIASKIIGQGEICIADEYFAIRFCRVY